MQDKWVTTIDINIGCSYNFHISNVLESHSVLSQDNTTIAIKTLLGSQHQQKIFEDQTVLNTDF